MYPLPSLAYDRPSLLFYHSHTDSAEAGTAEVPLEPVPPRPQSALHALKQDIGPLGLERVQQEIDKLECIDQLGLPADLFAHVSARTLESYRNHCRGSSREAVFLPPTFTPEAVTTLLSRHSKM